MELPPEIGRGEANQRRCGKSDMALEPGADFQPEESQHMVFRTQKVIKSCLGKEHL